MISSWYRELTTGPPKPVFASFPFFSGDCGGRGGIGGKKTHGLKQCAFTPVTKYYSVKEH